MLCDKEEYEEYNNMLLEEVFGAEVIEKKQVTIIKSIWKKLIDIIKGSRINEKRTLNRNKLIACLGI